MMRAQNLDVQRLIEDVVRARFSEGSIGSVRVERETDLDGESFLHVLIIVDKPFNEADERNMLGLVRHLRTQLAEAEETNFPVIDFISERDADKLKREIA